MAARMVDGGDGLRSGASEEAEERAAEPESKGKVRGGVGRLRGVRGRQKVEMSSMATHEALPACSDG